MMNDQRRNQGVHLNRSIDRLAKKEKEKKERKNREKKKWERGSVRVLVLPSSTRVLSTQCSSSVLNM
jgi:CelD/BcsL family acetyltransferase involved in cellulose biosynthesis